MHVVSLWPQVLIAMLMVALVVAGLVRHGKPVDPKPVNALAIIWVVFTIAAVLGAGGFWRL